VSPPPRPAQPPLRTDRAPLVAAGGLDAAYVATPHYLASEAALAVMTRGGNAIDGAITANAVQGVVAPDTCGVGGDLFALVHRPGEVAPLALNSSGVAGSGVSADALRRDHDTMPYRHPWTITTPGCVAGWAELSARLGAVPLHVALEPAVELAESGFPASPELARSLQRLQGMIGSQPSAAPLYRDGAPPAPGDPIRRPGLAGTLRAVAENGPAAFYEGEVAAAIVAATDGGLSLEDVAGFRPDWVDPIGIDVFGVTGWTTPPNTQGYIALAACWILEALGPPPDPADPAYVHAAIEAYRAVAWERDELVADPATAPLPPAELLASERLRGRLDALSPQRAAEWPRVADAPGGTAFMCVRDGTGVGVSLIQSNFAGIGTGISAGDTGVFLHNRGAGFNLHPGHPNELRPGKRPLHTLAPTVWTDAGNLRLLLGTRGGQYQPQLLVQVAAHLLYTEAPRASAQPEARWQVNGWRPGEASVVGVESRMAGEIVAGLVERGHGIERVPDWQEGWGPVSLIAVTLDDVFAAVDPRVSTSTALRASAG